MTNYAVGHQAEQQAADFLLTKGYKIRDINWKSRSCEIDIIAEKDRTMYFFEVKYRLNDRQGQGFDYITHQKLRQMAYAAEVWLRVNKWSDSYCLGAIELTGPNFEVTGFIGLLD